MSRISAGSCVKCPGSVLEVVLQCPGSVLGVVLQCPGSVLEVVLQCTVMMDTAIAVVNKAAVMELQDGAVTAISNSVYR